MLGQLSYLEKNKIGAISLYQVIFQMDQKFKCEKWNYESSRGKHGTTSW